MKLREVEVVQQAGTPVEYLAEMGFLPGMDIWQEATIAAIDASKEHPRVWLNVGNSGGVTLEGKKDIKERLRVKTDENN